MFSQYLAIDPLALLLSSEAYVRLVEKLHPHVPKVSELQEVVRSMTPEEKAFALARARAFIAYSKAVEEALGGPDTAGETEMKMKARVT